MAHTKFTEAQKMQIVKHVNAQRTRGEDAMNMFRDKWDEEWRAFLGWQDYSDKASWQSRVFVPKVIMKIETAAGQIKKAMSSKQLFKLRVDIKKDRKVRTELLTRMMRDTNPDHLASLSAAMDQLDEVAKLKELIRDAEEDQFRDDLTETNMISAYGDNSKEALLTGISFLKPEWDFKQNRPTFKHIQAYNVRLDPDWQFDPNSDPSFVCEDYNQTFNDLKLEAKEVNKRAKESLYDMKAIEGSKGSITDALKASRERDQQGLINNTTTSSDEITLIQYWGDIPKADGDGYLIQNAKIIISDAEKVIFVEENPFLGKRMPYIITIPITYPHRGAVGRSLAEKAIPMNYVYNNVWNLIIDNLNFTVNKMFQYNPAHFQNQKEPGVAFPGKQWKHTQAAGAKVVNEVAVTPIERDAYETLGLIKQDIEEAMNVSRVMEGQPSSTKRTLGEVQIDQQQGQSFFALMAKDMETTSVKPMLERTWDLYTQFGGYNPREGRYLMTVGGISLMVMVQAMIAKMERTLEMALGNEAINGLTDVKYLYRRYLELQELGEAFENPEGGRPALNRIQAQNIQERAARDAKQIVGDTQNAR